MPDPTQNELPNEAQNKLDVLSFLTGVYFDTGAGPITASSPAVVLHSSNAERIRAINDSVIEDSYPENEQDAHHTRLGWPPLSRLPKRPWDILTPRDPRLLKSELWGSRRFSIQRCVINVSPRDLCPAEALVEAIEDALSQRTNALRIQALREVFVTWGEMIPVNLVVGACLVATGTLNDITYLPNIGTASKLPSKEGHRNPTDTLDRYLGVTRSFTRRLEIRIQGGSSNTLLTQDQEAWLQSVDETPASWRIIKVNHAILITDILSSQLRDRVEKLFINSLIVRSPSIGEPQLFGFDGASSGLRDIEKIIVWFSNFRIRDISVVYRGGVTVGPYSFGLSNPLSQSDAFLLASGEYITDIFVWRSHDGFIGGIQFVKNSLECSPIYGVLLKNNFQSHPPTLLDGNGNALLGISGTYTSEGVSQITAVWRSDVVLRRKRRTQTSFTGGYKGYVFNDLQYLPDPAVSRIAQITACARTSDGTVCDFRTTYESVSEGALIRSETPARGSSDGPRVTMTLEAGEHIIGTHPAFGTATGQTSFSIDAPKTPDGRDMVLHYMAGKYWSVPLLTGVFLDPAVGPVAASRPAAVLHQSSTDKIRMIDNSVTEDLYSETELEAHYAGLGWPSLNKLPPRPWDAPSTARGSQHKLDNETWALRRFMVQRATINLSLQDIRPVEALVEAFETALGQETYDLQIQALQEVFRIWGEFIPLNAIAGAFMGVTGILSNGTSFPNGIVPSSSDAGNQRYSLTEIVDRQLGTSGCFGRRLETRVQGGSSQALLTQGCDAWLRSIDDSPESWSIVKVYRTVLITDILSERLRDRIRQLFTGSVISRSPSVGSPNGSGFNGAAHGVRTINKITIWFSDSKVRDLAVRYDGGAAAGPYSYGNSNPQSQSDVLVLAPGEYITDVFVWHHQDGWIMGIQFVKSTLELSPIYGIGSQNSSSIHSPVLLAGDGKALLGISGAFTSDSLSQVQAVWRNDVALKRQRHTQTSYTGNPRERIYNDLQHLANPANARIVQITGRAEGAVASFRTTYESISGGSLVRSETPSRGTDVGPLQTMTLEPDEYIIGVRGSHNNWWMHQIQFVTNKRTHPAFGTENGNVPFSFDAPKTMDGRDMVLHYMVGTSGGCLHSALFVWAEMPL